GAHVFAAREPQLASHCTRQIATDRKTKTGAAAAPVERIVELHEGLEDGLALVARDPDAGVHDADVDRPVLWHALDDYPAAGRRELRGVGEQVDDHLLQPRRVRVHRARRIARLIFVFDLL